MQTEHTSRTGRFVLLPRGGAAFVPKSLPPEPGLEVDHELWRLLSQADRSLGRLDGSTEILPNPDLFLAMYVRKEAVLSSEIEGTQASLVDVLEYEVRKPKLKTNMDVGEVVNYVAAMNYGLEHVLGQPITLSLVQELHARLLAGTRGGDKAPGQFRTRQNWLGPEGTPITAATYVPPPPEEIESAMRQLVQFAGNPGPLPPLISIGLAHAQFETIHPFIDGNGRIGRLLVTLLLCRDRLLKRPLLYLSYYFKKNRLEYYDRLQATREPGAWEGWLKFFIRGVAEAADDATETAKRILNLREEHRRLLQTRLGLRSGPGLALLERLYRNPVVDVKLATQAAGLTYANTNRLISELEKLGILKETTGLRRNRRFAYEPYLRLFKDE